MKGKDIECFVAVVPYKLPKEINPSQKWYLPQMYSDLLNLNIDG